MKKFIMLSAVMAAVSTAFVACSSDEDLAQQPKAPETIVDTPKGTPFSLSVSAATRAKLYNEDAWDGSDVGDGNWVNQIVLYGKQTDAWLNSNIFVRTSKAADASWTTNRTLTATGVSTPTWPTENTSTPTEFYAITDNDMIIDDDNANISNVGAWMSTLGTFTYTMAKVEGEYLPHIDPNQAQTGKIVAGGVETDYVNVSTLKDLMVASATKKESETTNGQLELTFSHVLAGLSIKAIFLNNEVLEGYQAYQADNTLDFNSGNALIHYIKIMGLKTSGTYTFNPSGTDPNWDISEGAYVCYYKAFSPAITVNAFAEPDYPDGATADQKAAAKAAAIAAADENKWLVEKTDPWMVIPQPTDPWDCQGCSGGKYIADGKAYIVLGITDHLETENVEIFLPLDTEFVAGKNKTLRLDIGKFRDLYNNTGDAAYYFEPAQATGGARGYDFIDE